MTDGILIIKSGLLCFLVFVVSAERLSDQVFNNLPLLVGHGIQHVLDGLVLVGFFLGRLFRGRFIFLGFFLLWSFFGLLLRLGMLHGFFVQLHAGFEFKALVVSVPNCCLGVALLAMGQNRELDFGSGIRAGQYQAQFTDHAVNDIAAALHQLVCIDAQAVEVSVPDAFPGMASHVCIVKTAIGVNAFFPVFQQSMADDPGGIVVIVLVYQRNRSPVVVFEGVFPNGSAISAQKIVLRRPSAEVEFVFLHPYLPFLYFSQKQKSRLPF